MSERAGEAIRKAIEDHGPISFAEFMELALYGPGGFYQQPPVGEAGHYVTSPHVHPVFARLVALALDEMWQALGKPEPFRILELGAGDGTLARQLLPHLIDEGRGPRLAYVAVERSVGARARLARLGLHVLPSIEAAPTAITGCVIANELLDNLPFHWLRGTPQGVVEVHVDHREDGFVRVEEPWAPEDLDPADATIPALGPDEELALSLHALRLIERLPGVLASGYALFIDYAGPVSAGKLVHGYRRHGVVEDVFAHPGSADITAGVDLSSAAGRAEALGFQAFPVVSQRAALMALGYSVWIESERHRQGALLEATAAREAVEAWSGRNAAALLVDRAGLGRLRWLVVATAGLPKPAWLSKAARIDSQGSIDPAN